MGAPVSPRAKQSAKRLAVPVSDRVAAQVTRLADKHGLPEAQIARLWMETMPERWDPIGRVKR